jgi:hypothetical protein
MSIIIITSIFIILTENFFGVNSNFAKSLQVVYYLREVILNVFGVSRKDFAERRRLGDGGTFGRQAVGKFNAPAGSEGRRLRLDTCGLCNAGD